MSIDAIVMMIFSMSLIWGGLVYCILRSFVKRSNNRQRKDDIQLKKY